MKLTNLATPGAYSAGTGLGFQVLELYKCPNAQTSESSFHINAGRARPFRAPGVPQGSWALEQMMDMLAEKIGMDPVEFRLKNFTDVSQTRKRPYTSTGLRECLLEGAAKFGESGARRPEIRRANQARSRRRRRDVVGGSGISALYRRSPDVC